MLDREQLEELAKELRLLAKYRDVPHFRGWYEPAFNFWFDRAMTTPAELAALERLFDVVSWFSPIADQETYPNYTNEQDVFDAAWPLRRRVMNNLNAHE